VAKTGTLFYFEQIAASLKKVGRGVLEGRGVTKNRHGMTDGTGGWKKEKKIFPKKKNHPKLSS